MVPLVDGWFQGPIIMIDGLRERVRAGASARIQNVCDESGALEVFRLKEDAAPSGAKGAARLVLDRPITGATVNNAYVYFEG